MAKQIYIDMDGTLCRFHDAEHKYIEQMWEKGFYANLQPFEEFVKAISLCIDRNADTEFFIISAVLDTEPPFVEGEKREWLHRHLPQLSDENMLFVPAGADKSSIIPEMSADCILIDDYNKNLSEWRIQGGTAIKFINDINDRGLGAYGGEIGNIWDGERVRYNDSAMATCLRIERLSGIKNTIEKENAFYGFSDDVLPDQFLELLPSYFSVRQTHDTHLIQELYRKGEGFFDYESVSAHSRNFVREITTDKQNGQLALYQRENNLNDAMMNCLDTCYTLSRAYAIPFNKITGWMSASIRHENLWQTYPVTCSNLQSYITKQLARDTRLTVLADQIKTVSTQLNKAESRVYLPASSDVEMDVTSGGVQKSVLSEWCKQMKAQLKGYSDEWRQLAGTEYPNILFGNGQIKYQKYADTQKTSRTIHQK